ncbi:MAG TPA: hypothetical protein PLW49_02195, partial [bacterium]|nr:hypothetical protein [bacterium]
TRTPTIASVITSLFSTGISIGLTSAYTVFYCTSIFNMTTLLIVCTRHRGCIRTYCSLIYAATRSCFGGKFR